MWSVKYYNSNFYWLIGLWTAFIFFYQDQPLLKLGYNKFFCQGLKNASITLCKDTAGVNIVLMFSSRIKITLQS